jgi:hypothetical protein
MLCGLSDSTDVILVGFDHGVGHPLLLLYDAKVSNDQKSKAFKGLDHYSGWQKVGEAVIEAKETFTKKKYS